MSEDKAKTDQGKDAPELKPALPELGTTLCPVCKRRVTVFVTKTHRPFINCGFCSARVFYNGSRAIRRLQRRLKKDKRESAPAKPNEAQGKGEHP